MAKLGRFALLNRLFPNLYITSEAHQEVVVAGAGVPANSSNPPIA
jgi:hypothetical protein